MEALSRDLSPTSSHTSVMTPTPLKLNNIGMLLRQLQYNDEVARFDFSLPLDPVAFIHEVVFIESQNLTRSPT